MADTQQGVRHQSARDTAGTTDTYDGDLRALFEAVATVPPGSTFNEAFMLWLQSVTGSSSDNINDLAALHASQQDDTYNWSSGGPLLGLQVLFQLNSEISEEPPAISSFTRADTKQVLTTSDGSTFWYQTIKSGEVSQTGQRRNENNVDKDLTNWTIQSTVTVTPLGSDEYEVDFDGLVGAGVFFQDLPGPTGVFHSFNIEMRVPSGSGDIQITDPSTGSYDVDRTLTTSWQQFSLVTPLTTNGTSGIFLRRRDAGQVGIIQVRKPAMQMMQDAASVVDEYVDNTVIYNAEVAGVRYDDTTNGNSVDVNGVVTLGAGVAITGGGLFIEPIATNLCADSSDPTVWTVGGVSFVSQGIEAIGFLTYEADVGALNESHRYFTGGSKTAYAIAKGVTGRYFTVRSGNGATEFATYDLTNGVVSDTKVNMTSRINNLGNAWYKNEVTNDLSSGLIHLGFSDIAAPATDDFIWQGANETYDIAHAQAESTEYSTSPIFTSSGTSSRLADVFDTGAVIAEEFGALLDITLPAVVGTGNTISLLGADASAVDILRVNAAGDVIMDDGGTPVTVGTAILGTRVKVSYGRDATGRSASLEGATAVTGDAPAAGHEGNTFQVGSTNSVNQSRCIHHLTTLYAKKPTDQQLKVIST